MKNTAYLRYTVAIVALLMGFALSIRYSERGFLVESPSSELFATPETTPEGYDLQALTILNRTILQLGDNYVDPDRIDTARMLVYALDQVQNEVPEVVALFNAGIEESPTEVTLHVGAAESTFDISAIESLWEMSFKLREIFRFMQEHLDPNAMDLREVEYAAINGMLGTLDPHSVLLTPDVYAEMQAANHGSFGGLGIVISVRDGQLTVISPIADTPASRAGFQAGDRIVQINDESTVNMPLDEAVSRLRGPEGTQVTIEIMRQGWTEPHAFTLTRAIINIESISYHALGDRIGYVEVRAFQGNTHEDLLEALEALRTEMGGIDGLVLDLRNNPGGLLQQAIQISDTFLTEGTIVTTVGMADRHREENPANPTDTEPFYPIVVLVNPGSASASEIVAGALKAHDRALIVGDTTFGKGSVQVLYEFVDGSALKLTIAQYLTPGDVSIQGVGIVPDVRIIPVTVTEDVIDLYPSENVVREGDLEAHLTSEHAGSDAGQPSTVVKYYLEPAEEMDPNAIQDPDAFEIDFEIDFAQRVLLAAGETWDRNAMLEAASDAISEVEAAQLTQIREHLRNLNVDWTPGEFTAQPVTAAVTTSRTDNTVPAGEVLTLTLSVTNDGDAPLYQVRGVSSSDYRSFDDHEFVIGMLEPGATASWTLDVTIPEEDWTQYANVDVELYAGDTSIDATASTFITVQGAERPHWAFRYHIDDVEGGNGDGQLQVGETVRFVVDVTNSGRGDAAEATVYLRNRADAALFLRSGREALDNLEAGATHSAAFEFTVQERPESGRVDLDVEVYDSVFREFLHQELVVPVLDDDATERVEGASGFWTTTAGDTPLRIAPVADAPVMAMAPQGAVLQAQARVGDWLRVGLDDDTLAWISTEMVTEQGGQVDTSGVVLGQPYAAPQVTLNREVLVTSDDMFRLEGTVDDASTVRDYYVLVYNRVSENRRQSTKRAYTYVGATHADIAVDVPLRPGMNRITLVARDASEASSTDVHYVYRVE